MSLKVNAVEDVCNISCAWHSHCLAVGATTYMKLHAIRLTNYHMLCAGATFHIQRGDHAREMGNTAECLKRAIGR
jgi:hypothetical protein